MNFGSIADYWIYCALVAIGLVVAILIVGRRIFDPRRIAFIFLAVSAVTYLVRPIAQFAIAQNFSKLAQFHERYEPIILQEQTIPLLGVLTAFYLVLFSVGYRLSAPSGIRFSGNKLSPQSRQRILHFSWVLICVGYFSLFYGRGGVELVKTEVGAGMVGTSGYFTMLSWWVGVGVLLRIALTRKYFASAFLAFPWLASYLLSGFSRYTLIILFLAVFLLISFYRATPNRKMYAAMGLLALAILIPFTMMSMNRKVFTSGESLASGLERLQQVEWYGFLNGFSGFEGSMMTLDRMNRGLDEPRLGTSLIYETTVMAIPRRIWSGKPFPPEFHWNYILSLGKDKSLSSSYAPLFNIFYVRGNLGSSLMEWGLWLFWLNPFFYGLIGGTLERLLLRKGTADQLRLVIYCLFWATFCMMGRNTIYDYFGQYMIGLFAPLLLMLWHQTRMEKRRFSRRITLNPKARRRMSA